MKRHATAVWNGSGKEGGGTVSTKSGALKDVKHHYKSRFEDGIGTNPEELVAAAHASCFTMKLSFVLGEAGFTPESLDGKLHTLQVRVKRQGMSARARHSYVASPEH